MKIGISIVQFGEQKVLDDCLKSFGNEHRNEFDLHWLVGEDEFDISIFDCNKVNIGFTAGNNECIEKLNSNPFNQWIWLLNNDTTIPKETLEAIQKILPDIGKDIGVVGFKILSMDNPDLIHHGGTIQCFPAGIHKSGSVRLRQLNERTTEKWVTFSSVLIRREVFEQIGLLDENMKHICSDSDLCYRARAHGWKVIYEPSFVIYHKIGTSQNPNPEIQKQMQQDAMYFQSKWLSGKLFYDLDHELI